MSLHFGMCYLSERILQKFDKLLEAIYDIPWYEMPVTSKEKLLLIPIMLELQRRPSFKSAGVFEVTFERFKNVIEIVYRNCLVVQNLFS